MPLNRIRTLETLVVLALACLLFGGFFQSRGLLIGCGMLLALALFPNRLADLVVTLWLKFGQALGTVMTRVLLTGIYFLCLVPLALLSRPFTRDSRKYFYSNDRSSFFVSTEGSFRKEDFEKPW